MKKNILTLVLLFLIISCSNNELEFTYKEYEKKTSLDCDGDCPKITVKIPIAKNVPIVADSINKKVFDTLKEIIYFGEDPFVAKDYEHLLGSFIDSYEEIKEKFPNDAIEWQAEINGKIKYISNRIVNIEIDHYTYAGGAHGYSGLKSLIFDKETGKIIPNEALFNNFKDFEVFAEKKFRIENNIQQEGSINASGLLFEDDVFQLSNNIFYTDEGLLLYFNTYEVASYADGPKELLLPYNEIKNFLKIK